MKLNIEREIEKAMSKIPKNLGKAPRKTLKKYPVMSECPVCNNDLEVKKLSCGHCGTEIDGLFTLSKFNYLSTEKLFFIETFVKNRGNIKAIEKELGYSYPTIKKMLDDVISDLGYSVDQKDEEILENEEPKKTKIEILNMIDSGEISVEEATKLLAKIKWGGCYYEWK